MMLFKESRKVVFGIYFTLGLVIFNGPLWLLYLITGEESYIDLAKQSLAMFMFLSLAYVAARQQFVNGSIEIHKGYLIGPSARSPFIWRNKQVKIPFEELADPPVTQPNLLCKLLGIYTINSKKNSAIIIVKPFFDKNIVKILRDHINEFTA